MDKNKEISNRQRCDKYINRYLLRARNIVAAVLLELEVNYPETPDSSKLSVHVNIFSLNC